MNPYLSLVSIRIPHKPRREAARNYLKSGGANLLQSWPVAGLPLSHPIGSRSVRSQRTTHHG